MHKKKIIFIILSLSLMGITTMTEEASAIISCQNQHDSAEMPCLEITPSLNCTSDIVVRLSNSSFVTNITMFNRTNDNSFNATINLSTGIYKLTLCDGQTATFEVGDFKTTWKLAVILSILAIASSLIFFSIKLSKEHLPLSVLLSFSALWFLSMATNIGVSLTRGGTSSSAMLINTTTLYNIFLWVIFLFAAYLSVFFIATLITDRKEKRMRFLEGQEFKK